MNKENTMRRRRRPFRVQWYKNVAGHNYCIVHTPGRLYIKRLRFGPWRPPH